MKAKLINGRCISSEIKLEVANGVSDFKQEHRIAPGLAVILVGEDPASTVYVRNKQSAAIEVGMVARDIHLENDISQRDLLEQIEMINRDERFHGVLVQLPLPSHIDKNDVIESINPDKDVDGLHPMNMGLLVEGRQRFVPATPAGIQQMLIRSGFNPDGKHVVVCGRSEIVGKPIAILLAQRMSGCNATVTVCHTGTNDLAGVTKQADILVVAMGQPSFVTADMVKEQVVVIDVGVNRVEDSDRKNGYRLVGDVDFESVSGKAAAISPVPGGVGPMTIAMLLANTLKAAQRLV